MAAFTWSRAHSWVLLLGGIVGLIASFALTYDVIQVASDSSYVPGCTFNPILSCVSVMESNQGTVVGNIPNSMFGIIAFSMLVAFAGLLLFGALVSKRVWQLALAAASAGIIFVHYLIYESIFQIQSLCPWCMVTWSVVAPVFFLLLVKNLEYSPRISEASKSWISKNYIGFLVTWYLLVVALIAVEFWSYWQTLLT